MKNKKLIPWIITTTAVLSIGVVVNVLATQSFYDIICTVLSDRGTMEIVGTEKSRFEIPENIKTKKDAKEYGKKVTREICEEGFTLLKNKDNKINNNGTIDNLINTKIFSGDIFNDTYNILN